MANTKKVKLQGFKFKPFSEKQLKLLNWWQDNSPVKDKFMIIADGAIRSGKRLANSCLIPTPNGMVRNGDLKVGDFVFDRTGKKTKILGVYPHEADDMYKLTFSDGSSTVCSKEHLWTFIEDNQVVTKELQEFMDKDYTNLLFPMNGAVEFSYKQVSICGEDVGSTIEKYDVELDYNENFKEENVPTMWKLLFSSYESCCYQRKLPEDYKINNIVKRKNLLEGVLLEAKKYNRALQKDGYVKYYSGSKSLLDDVIFVARSLGLYTEECGNHCNIYGVYLLDNSISLNSVNCHKTLKSIEYVGKEEATCIYVDNEEHLYLCDDFIVTHNTVSMILSFVLFVMNRFNQQNAAMCGR